MTGAASEAGAVRISVILCTHNRSDVLLESLRALAGMQVDAATAWEVLVVDNASTDATRDAVRAFIEDGHPRFRYLHEPRVGKTYALNLGIHEARGQLLAFTDDDALVDPHWITAICSAFDRYSPDGVGGKVLPIWQSPRPDWLLDRMLNVLAIADFGDAPIRLNWTAPPLILYGVNFAFRREVFERIGTFNTKLGSKGEDQELFERLLEHRAVVVYDPAIVVRHMIHGSRLTPQYFLDWHSSSGRTRALLPIGNRPNVLGIPFSTIRDALVTSSRLVTATLRRDRATAFAERLRLEYLAAYCRGRLRGG